MRKGVAALAVIALAAGAAAMIGLPGAATAQGGGTIEVEVKYSGAPEIEKLKINKDTKVCGTEAEILKIAVGANKGLQWAVASVAGAKGGGKALGKAVIDQHGCAFVPHVVTMQAGSIEIKNSDGILHNIHTYSTANAPINKAQPKFKKVMTESFTKPEFVKVTCDVHSWMLGWVAVFSHPYFGVTNESGVAKIENVPAGKHTVEVWHEMLGTAKKEVDVKAGQTVKVAFEMKKG